MLFNFWVKFSDICSAACVHLQGSMTFWRGCFKADVFGPLFWLRCFGVNNIWRLEFSCIFYSNFITRIMYWYFYIHMYRSIYVHLKLPTHFLSHICWYSNKVRVRRRSNHPITRKSSWANLWIKNTWHKVVFTRTYIFKIE